MKKLLFTVSVAAFLVATGTAHAVEWQCGPHYVSTFVLHKEKPPYSIIAYPFYNRTREDVIKNKLPSGGDDEFVLPYKNFRWGYAPHPEFRGQRLLTYRGKPCLQYPIEAQQ
jgi:hypothetical protein